MHIPLQLFKVEVGASLQELVDCLRGMGEVACPTLDPLKASPNGLEESLVSNLEMSVEEELDE